MIRTFCTRLLTAFVLLFSVVAFSQERTGITERLALLDSIYSRVLKSYVEKPMEETLFRSAIDASLSTLDPYSNFMNAREAQDFAFDMRAKYGGIGLVMGTMNNTVYAKEIFKGYPADRGGIKPGDILIQIDSVSLKDKTIDQVFPLLLGQPGTQVKVKLFRPSANAMIDVTATRESVLLPSVPYYGLLPGGHGYIKITSETEQTFEEVKSALSELKKKGPLSGLVIDLRGNRGGYMSQAIKIANLFIEKGKVALSEKSWYSDSTRYFMEEPWDTEIPLVLLIDNMTASSGEILTGALQDHDRALLIGQKTFGKGMVQRVYDLPNGEKLKLTTAFYYTPSGRCIQRKEKGGQRTRDWTDSVKKIVYTANGRPVTSFDGIAPDISMPVSPEPPVVRDLFNWDNTHLFRFANQYLVSHPKILPASDFRITDAEYDKFIAFLKQEKFPLTSPVERQIDELEKALTAEGNDQVVKAEISRLREKLTVEKEKQFIVHKKQIKSLLEGEISVQYYYNWGREESRIKDDEEIKKAIEILSNWEKFKGQLKPKH